MKVLTQSLITWLMCRLTDQMEIVAIMKRGAGSDLMLPDAIGKWIQSYLCRPKIPGRMKIEFNIVAKAMVGKDW